jgi:hypothetical protein
MRENSEISDGFGRKWQAHAFGGEWLPGSTWYYLFFVGFYYCLLVFFFFFFFLAFFLNKEIYNKN